MSKLTQNLLIRLQLLTSFFYVTLSQTNDTQFCESWRFCVETNTVVISTTIPERCYEYVKDYMTGDRYVSDTELVAGYALEFAKSVPISGGGKDSWVFDVDETLLNHLPYYHTFGFGSASFLSALSLCPWQFETRVRSKVPSTKLRNWLLHVKAPPLQASLSLYKQLQQLGFTIFILTGRPETLRNVTESILLNAGYNHWKRFILRGPSDLSKSAIEYKSEKRKQLEDEGYIIHGNMGDQWSDLLGFAIAKRSFKVPNPVT